MPRYEFRCRACGDTFEVNRPMAQASAPCTCPQGHDDTVKLLSTVSVGGRASARESRARPVRRRLLRRRLRLRRLTRPPAPPRGGSLRRDFTRPAGGLTDLS